MNEMDEAARRRAFSVWLRVGRLPSAHAADGVEFKFNPWHDPENGRFTFAGTGHYYGRGSDPAKEQFARRRARVEYVYDPTLPYIESMEEVEIWRAGELKKHGHKPEYRRAIEVQYRRYKAEFSLRSKVQAARSVNSDTESNAPIERSRPRFSPADLGLQSDIGGGGGDFGGGGASGSWTHEAEARAGPASGADLQSNSFHTGSPKPTTGDASQLGSEGWRAVERNEYRFEIDDQNRTRRISGEITLNPNQGRSPAAQLAAGGGDRRENDHGGHYIARRFNGPTEAFNHFAQDGSFNRSEYAKLENQWEREKRLRKQVRVKIVPVFEGNSQRPSALNVWFWIDGHMESQKLSNKSKEVRDGK